jgi:hypothetical protein
MHEQDQVPAAEDWALLGLDLEWMPTCLCGSWPLDDYGTWCPSCERELWATVGLEYWGFGEETAQ